jgi:predicted metal-dependent peptidase
MATDGVTLFYNPSFVDTLNSATLVGVLAHEVMHPALQHHLRRSTRNPRRWNIACDYAINLLLLGERLSLPESGKISVGVVAIDEKPRTRIRIEATIKV